MFKVDSKRWVKICKYLCALQIGLVSHSTRFLVYGIVVIKIIQFCVCSIRGSNFQSIIHYFISTVVKLHKIYHKCIFFDFTEGCTVEGLLVPEAVLLLEAANPMVTGHVRVVCLQLLLFTLL